MKKMLCFRLVPEIDWFGSENGLFYEQEQNKSKVRVKQNLSKTALYLKQHSPSKLESLKGLYKI